MLATAGIADVIMAPAADMFEMGVEVQVLRLGLRPHQLEVELTNLFSEVVRPSVLNMALLTHLLRCVLIES